MAKKVIHSNITIPTNSDVLHEALRLCGDRDLKIAEFCSCAYQDPIICIELLKRANSLEFGVARMSITTIQNAILRIGWQELTLLTQELKQSKKIESPTTLKWLELHRQRSRRAGMVAKMIADSVSQEQSQISHLCGLFLYVGDMIATLELGKSYIDVVESTIRSRVNYRIITDYGIDIQEVGIDFLKLSGIPNTLIDIINKETQQKETSRHLIRPIVFGASEFVEAFEAGKINRYENFTDVPHGSHIRLLRLQEKQYNKLFAKIRTYLLSEDALQIAIAAIPKELKQTSLEITLEKNSDLKPSNLLQNTLIVLDQNQASVRVSAERIEKLKQLVKSKTTIPLVTKGIIPRHETLIIEEKNSVLEEICEQFGIRNTRQIRQRTRSIKVFYEDSATEVDESSSQSEKISLVSRILTTAEDSEQLIAVLLTTLIQQGFQKAAIIVTSKDKSEGLIVAARGQLEPGTRFKLNAANSSIAHGISRIQSTKDTSGESTLFDSSTYATAPLKADHQTTVTLYADCGPDVVINFEARRLFRSVVKSVNILMPRLPGGLLIEIPNFHLATHS
jgi:HD-like signal output (HDOD) protein